MRYRLSGKCNFLKDLGLVVCLFTYPSLPTPIFSTIHQMNWKLIMQCSFFRLRVAAGSLIISLVLLCLSYKWNKHTKQNLSIKLCMKYRNLLLNLHTTVCLIISKKNSTSRLRNLWDWKAYQSCLDWSIGDYDSAKGQLISKGLFCFFQFFQKTNKKFLPQ